MKPWHIHSLVLVVLLLHACASPLAGPSPDDLARDYADLGQGFLELNKPERAAAYYTRALELKPGYDPLVFNLALSLARAGKHAQALELLGALQVPEDQSALVQEARAWILAAQGDLGQARIAYEAYLAAFPPVADPAWNYLLLMTRLKALPDPGLLERIRETHADKADILGQILALYRAVGAQEPQVWDQVPALVDQWLGAGGKDGALLAGLAVDEGARDDGNNVRVASWYQRAWELDPSQEEAAREAVVRWWTEDRARAQAFLETAIKEKKLEGKLLWPLGERFTGESREAYLETLDALGVVAP